VLNSEIKQSDSLTLIYQPMKSYLAVK